MNHARLFDEVVSGPENDTHLYRVCHYDKSHIINAERYLNHVFRCRTHHVKKHGEGEMVLCKYNSEHHVTNAEYDAHLATCKDAYDMLRFDSAYRPPTTNDAKASEGKQDRSNAKKNKTQEDQAVNYFNDYAWEEELRGSPGTSAAASKNTEIVKKWESKKLAKFSIISDTIL